jgi:hypothetical protein
MKSDFIGCTALENPAGENICTLIAKAKPNVEQSNKGMCQTLMGADKVLCESIIDNDLEKCKERFSDQECRKYM